jgi:hypothetical protein
MMSGLSLLYASELMITAGRFLLVDWSVKGNGTKDDIAEIIGCHIRHRPGCPMLSERIFLKA